jgi:tetratricopeptide (TPR) repeat protein/DNA-binding XRE family transcriptional regulator
MPRAAPPPLSLALSCLRKHKAWTEAELAAAAGMRRQQICNFETGIRSELSRETLERLATAMGYGPEDVTLALLFAGGLAGAGAGERLSPVDPTPSEVRRARRIAARVGLTEASRMYGQLLDLARVRRVEHARRAAARLWDDVRRQLPARQRELAARAPEPHRWALVERLCAESVRAAADDAVRALRLARLALWLAEHTSGGKGWRLRLQGYAWAFVANAHRVANDLPAAVASFATAWELWRQAGPPPAGPLPEWRLLDLEGSLRRDLRQFPVALDCLDRALAAAPREMRGRILLNKQFTLEQAGDVEGALCALEEAAPLVDAHGEPRHRWAVRFNAIVVLCHLSRHAAAVARLPELRRMALERGDRLDLTRIVWLAGRIAAGLGRRGEAHAAFKQASQEFADARLGYDSALVSLDLAVLLLEEGRAAEVAGLAAEMLQIFQAQTVHREALAALQLFCRAARGGSATVDLARRVLAYLERARHDPHLRFEEAA